jgi:TatD DNase family protein
MSAPDAVARPPAPDPLPLPVVDGHTHLDIAATGRDGQPIPDQPTVAQLLKQAAAVGVTRSVQIGCDVASSQATVDLVEQFPQLVGGVALHPNEAPRLAARNDLDAAYREIERLAAHPQMRVIGETGLDYFRTGPDGVADQQASFRWHIDLAKRLGLALQIHDRDAHAEEGAPERTIFHCFSGDSAMARQCVEAGYILSFAGTVTFKNAQNLREALAITPLENLQVETDAPYLTPTPYRGQPNAGYLVPHTVRAMAQVLCVDVTTLCAALAATANRLYGPWREPGPADSSPTRVGDS